ncbi:hypothetical protein E2C01_086818 [Portunus trituberculatus]
MVIST